MYLSRYGYTGKQYKRQWPAARKDRNSREFCRGPTRGGEHHDRRPGQANLTAPGARQRLIHADYGDLRPIRESFPYPRLISRLHPIALRVLWCAPRRISPAWSPRTARPAAPAPERPRGQASVGPRPSQAGAQRFVYVLAGLPAHYPGCPGGLLTPSRKPAISRIGEGRSCAQLTVVIAARARCVRPSRRPGSRPGNLSGADAGISTAVICSRILVARHETVFVSCEWIPV